ncbi:MAG: ABC transporter ATP-binding protein, partial [Oscillospiraceae bacterium]|nr:ABC transporter ATP-binding protein [Oscillospiraceae bacterium]
MAEKKQSIRTETIRRVLHDLAGYKKWLMMTLLLAVVTVALTLCVPILIGKAIDRIESAGNVDFDAVTRILLT